MQTPQPVQRSDNGFVAKLMRRYGKLGGKLGLAIFDQGLFAGSNFLVNVLLARWMMPNEYGAYAVGFAWFLIAQNLYEALMLEPMAIYGAGKYASHSKRYFGAVFLFHIWFSLVVAIPFFIGTAFMQHDSPLVSLALFATALFMPALLARWLFRQPFYISSTIRLAVIGSVIYLVSVLVSVTFFQLIPLLQTYLTLGVIGSITARPVFWVVDGSLLNPFTAVLANGIAGGFTALVMIFVYVKPLFRGSAEISYREVYATHLKYGRWSSIERILMWFPANIFYLLMPVFYDLAVSGALRAFTNIEMPLYLTLTAIAAVLLPSFVRTYTNQGYEALIERVQQLRMMLLTLTVSLGLILIVAGEWIAHFLYDGKFDVYATLPYFMAMAVHLILLGLTSPLDLSLRARGLVKINFLARLLPNLVTLTLGIYLMIEYGLLGVKVTMAITAFTHLLVLMYLSRRVENKMVLADAGAVTTSG